MGAEVVGDPRILISGISGIKEAEPGDITFLDSAKYLDYVDKTNASAIITSVDIKKASKPIIKTDDPSSALTKLASLFSPPKESVKQGVHPTAIVGERVTIGPNVSIGPYVIIEDEAVIGQGCVIYPGVYIGYGTHIGEETTLYPHVSIREQTSIGKRVIIHSSAVIGADGFGYHTVEKTHRKIPHIGRVVIEDDVEIGANVTIDRARVNKTLIGKGTKIDNLVHIAHNVIIGKHCIIVAQVGISGSTTVGDNTTIAGQAGLAGHLVIGDNVIIGAQAGVTKSIPSNTFVSGYPARPHKEAAKINAYIQRLPHLYDTVSELKSRVERMAPKRKKPHGKSAHHKKRNKH